MEFEPERFSGLEVDHKLEFGEMQLTARTGAATFEECVKEGTAFAGSPKTVLTELEQQVAELGVNYLLTYHFLGNMTFRDATRSLNLFSTEVMPKLARF
jgi:alkanesulfonate monooxygenase SsuD/methylene tetrahydromethanopterin reductase-like flavin-dependent oxidoreductase (luciferase family)